MTNTRNVIAATVIALFTLLLLSTYMSASVSARTDDVYLTDVICAPGVPGCSSMYSRPITITAAARVEVWAVHTGQWEINEWSAFTIDGIANMQCGPIPLGAEDVLCGVIDVPAGVHLFTATHLGQIGHDRQTGSHKQWWSVVSHVSDCFAGDNHVGQHCLFFPLFFRQGPDWAAFGTEQ